MIYWFPFVVISLLLYYLRNLKIGNYNCKILFRCLLSVFLSLMIAFGGSKSTDYSVYWDSYNYVSTSYIDWLDIFGFFYKNFEPGFYFLMYIFNFLNIGFPGFIFILYFIGNYIILEFIDVFKYPFLCFFVFISSLFYVQEANIIRQMFAVIVFCFSIRYIYDRNLFKYLVCIFICISFHKSSAVLLPFYYILKLGKCEKILFLLWVISILYYGGFSIIDLNFIFMEFSFNDNVIDYSYYEDYDNMNLGYTTAVVYNILQIIVFYYLRSIAIDKIDKIVMYLFSIGVIIYNFSFSLYILYRLSYYFLIFYIVMPSVVLYYSKNKINDMIKSRIIFLFVLLIILYHIYSIYIKISLNTSVGVGAYYLSLEEFFKL